MCAFITLSVFIIIVYLIEMPYYEKQTNFIQNIVIRK